MPNDENASIADVNSSLTTRTVPSPAMGCPPARAAPLAMERRATA
jgi:hypothetical protein